MQLIIMDLEWNTAYCKKTKGYINEIIEFGACKVDEQFNVIDEFSAIVKAQIGKKLQGRVKALTHITNEEISNGIPFFSALSGFKKWVGDDDNIFFTWGDGDVRTLIKNYEFFLGKKHISFLKNYCDVQKYCQSFIPSAPSSQQIGLSSAAERLGVNPNDFPHHRALDDSMLTAACIKKVYDPDKITKYVNPCNQVFYDKLDFKPRIIHNIDNPVIDKSKFNCVCDVCGGKVKKKKDWRFVSQSFRADFYCPKCDRNFKVCVRFKQYYDHLDVKRSFSEIVKQDRIKEKQES